MYITGEDVPTDKPRAMAWVAIAAERGDQHYVAARELAYSELTPEELAKANEIWRDLKNTYAPSFNVGRKPNEAACIWRLDRRNPCPILQ